MHQSHNIQISESNGEEQSLQTLERKIPFFDKQPSRSKPKTKQINGMGKQDSREWEERIEMLIINLIWWLPTQNSIMNESYAAKIPGNFLLSPISTHCEFGCVLSITICHILSYRFLNVSENFHADYYDSDMCIVYTVYKGIAGYCRSMKHKSLDGYIFAQKL